MKSIRLVVVIFVLLVVPMSLSGAALTQPDDLPQTDFLTGQFLIAVPEMGDPRFYHAVILMVHHDGNGAFGIIVNRPVEDRKLAQLLADLGQSAEGIRGSITVYAGGPVEQHLGFILHSADYQRPETMAIDGKIGVTSSPAVLRDIAEKRGPRKFIFAFGYAGWGPGQLENELKQQAWFTAPGDLALLFDDDRAKLWQDAVSRRSRAL
jgi:putative transcriptional regulator